MQNVKDRCLAKGIGVTAACQNSGAGKSFISDINRGVIPRVERIEKLAFYLDCAVSDLLGEEKKPTTVSGDGPKSNRAKLLAVADGLDDDDYELLVAQAELMAKRKQKK